MANWSSPGETTRPDPTAGVVRLTVAQTLVKFPGAQYSESDGEEQKLASATSTLESTQQARKAYDEQKATQKLFL